MISDLPLVSIVIPVYNRDVLVVQAIESACNQTYKNIEVIVVDNKSTDNTWNVICEIAKKDARVNVFQNKENLGPVLNWKQCFEKSKGEYIQILFSDDLLSENFVAASLNRFDADTAFVLAPIEIFDDESGEVFFESKYQIKDNYSSDYYLKDVLLYSQTDFPVSPGCAFFRAVDLVGSLKLQIDNNEGLDFKKMGAGNDLLLYLIIAGKYKNIGIAKECSAKFRSHSGSITTQNNLEKFYEWAKLYFINNYEKTFLQDYKVKIYFKKKKHGSLINIWLYLKPVKINFISFLSFVVTKAKWKYDKLLKLY
jgi:glycosyltransferase involved in cell wall biosynthesis